MFHEFIRVLKLLFQQIDWKETIVSRFNKKVSKTEGICRKKKSCQKNDEWNEIKATFKWCTIHYGWNLKS